MNSIVENTHIVLVKPQNSLNIGSILRSMANLGFHNLHVVAPENYQEKKVAVTACNASYMMEKINFHDTLPEALADMQDVVGFSARDGRNRSRSFWLPEWSAMRNSDSNVAKTALVFGPEDNGLSQEDLSHCRSVITIPTAENYSSYNLAQAVMLALYQIRLSCWSEDAPHLLGKTEKELLAVKEPERNSSDLTEWKEFYYLDSIVDSVLQASHFFRDGTPSPVPLIIKRLLRRTNPDKREMGILLGMFRRIEGVLVGRVPVKQVRESSPDLKAANQK